MGPAWFCVGHCKSLPNFRRSGQDGLNRCGDCSKQYTVNQAVLSFPECVGRIGCDSIISGDRRWRHNDRSLNIAAQVIAIKQSMDMSTPDQKIGTRKLCHISHIDIENGGSC